MLTRIDPRRNACLGPDPYPEVPPERHRARIGRSVWVSDVGNDQVWADRPRLEPAGGNDEGRAAAARRRLWRRARSGSRTPATEPFPGSTPTSRSGCRDDHGRWEPERDRRHRRWHLGHRRFSRHERGVATQSRPRARCTARAGFRGVVKPAELEKWWGPRGFAVPWASSSTFSSFGGIASGCSRPKAELLHLAGEAVGWDLAVLGDREMARCPRSSPSRELTHPDRVELSHIASRSCLSVSSSGTPPELRRSRLSGERGVDLGQRLEERGREARGRLGGGDLVHLADVAARLRRRARETPLDVGDELGRAGAEIGEDVLEDAVRVRGTQRLQQDRGAPLVDRGGAHLHRGGRSDGIADDDQVDAVERELRDLSRTWPGEVDARRPGFPRRRSRDRSVHQLELRGDLERGCGRDGVQLDEERRATGFVRRSQDGVSGCSSVLRRHDREEDSASRDHRREVGKQLDRCRALGETRGPRTAPSSVATTRAPPRPSASAMALPIAPRLTTPTVGTASAARHVSRDGEPAAVAASPHIRIPTCGGRTVGKRVARPRVDDRDVADDPHVHVVRLEIRDRDRLRRLLEKRCAVDQRPVRVRAQEVVREDLVEALRRRRAEPS